jgi:chromosomal replication initiator protein
MPAIHEAIRDLPTSRSAVGAIIAVYICREYTKSSLPDIGKQFGGKDHTTVIFSHKKITKLVKENNPIAMNIDEIVERIEGE